MQHPDQKYIEALLHNDLKLLDELYSKYSGKIKWMVLKNNGSEEDAADIFQEALITIFRKANEPGFELTCPFDAFLYLICRKKWLNVLSKRSNQGVTKLEEEGSNYGEDSFLLAEEVNLHDERLKLLNEKVSELGDGCRDLLRLSWTERSMEEVAIMLNYTYSYARKKKSECMAKLVNLVKQSPEYKNLKW